MPGEERDPPPADQKRTVREGYDRMAAFYDDERSLDGEDDAALQALADDLPDGARVLDLGCGGGRGALRAFDGFETVGLDFSRAQLSLARYRVDADLVLGDMATLPFATDSFDAVTALYSVIHLPVEQHRTVYDEVARVLRPGGRFLLTIGDDWAGSNDDWLDSGTRMEWSFPPLEETAAALTAAGLSVVERYAVHSEMDETDWPFIRCRLPASEE